MNAFSQMLAFTPLIDPLPAIFPNLSDWWLLLVVPLVVVISLVYKCTRTEDLSQLPRGTIVMSVQILVVMSAAAAGLYLIFAGITQVV